MISLDSVSVAVNAEVPDFNLWIYRPTDMQATRNSNCLGRAMLSYVLARAQGISDEAMGLLVEVDHGVPRQSGGDNLGHVALLVDDTKHDVTGVIDSGDHSFVKPLALFTWQPGLAPEAQDGIAMVFPRGPEAVESAGPPYFTAYSVATGLSVYQQRHSRLRNQPSVTIADYWAVYGGLTHISSHNIQSRPDFRSI